MKAEDYGWALMDVGVGSVMFCSGLTNRLIVTHKNQKRGSFIKELISSVTGNLGIFLGGTVRFFLLTGIDYHDHVTEWGVHWNFFCTIAILNVIQVFIRSSKYTIYYGFGLLVASELVQ